MSLLLDLAKFGVAIFAIGAICYVVHYFLKFVKTQEDNFTDLVKNHLNHNNEIMGELKDSIKQIYFWLERHKE